MECDLKALYASPRLMHGEVFQKNSSRFIHLSLYIFFTVVIHTDDFVQLIKDNKPPIVPGDPDDFVHQFLLGAYMSFIKTG